MESKLVVKEKTIVTPGEILAEGMDYLPSRGTYREDETILSSATGLVRVDGKVLKVIPMSGEYLPKKDDVIVGQVVDMTYSGWFIDTNSAYQAMLNMKDASSEFIPRGADLSQYFDIGDYVVVKVYNVTSQNMVDVNAKGPGLRKLKGGRIIKIHSSKVPRVIGKRGSMVTLIKDKTNTDIVVGQNGIVWLSSTDPANENLATRAIKKIEAEAHTSGLTDRMSQWLEEQQ